MLLNHPSWCIYIIYDFYLSLKSSSFFLLWFDVNRLTCCLCFFLFSQSKNRLFILFGVLFSRLLLYIYHLGLFIDFPLFLMWNNGNCCFLRECANFRSVNAIANLILTLINNNSPLFIPMFDPIHPKTDGISRFFLSNTKFRLRNNLNFNIIILLFLSTYLVHLLFDDIWPLFFWRLHRIGKNIEL